MGSGWKGQVLAKLVYCKTDVRPGYSKLEQATNEAPVMRDILEWFSISSTEGIERYPGVVLHQ